MKLPPRFVLVIEGTLWGVVQRRDDAALLYLLGRLFRGESVGEGALEAFGFRIFIEPNTDGGDEEPCALRDWRSAWDQPV